MLCSVCRLLLVSRGASTFPFDRRDGVKMWSSSDSEEEPRATDVLVAAGDGDGEEADIDSPVAKDGASSRALVPRLNLGGGGGGRGRQNQLPGGRGLRRRTSIDSDDESSLIHGDNAFLGSRDDPLHPENLNSQMLMSSKLLNMAVSAFATDDAEDDDGGGAATSKCRPLVKGVPAEVERQYRELLDAGCVVEGYFELFGVVQLWQRGRR